MSPLIHQLNSMGLETMTFPMPDLFPKQGPSLVSSIVKKLKTASKAAWDWLARQSEEAEEIHNRMRELSRQDTRNPYNSFYLRNRTF